MTRSSSLPVLVLLLASCGSLPILGGAGSKTDAETVALEQEAAAARAQAAVGSAQNALQSGDPLSAFSIANRALSDERTPAELRDALRKIRAEARAAIVITSVMRVSAVPDRDAVADREPVTLRVTFRNLTSDVFVIPRSTAGSSLAQLQLEVTRTDYDVYGNSRSSESQLRRPLDEDLRIMPGGARSVEFPLPAVLTSLDHQGFTVIDVEGRFRPVVLQVGETEFFDALEIAPARVHVFQKGFEHVAADPLGSLEKAVEKRSPPHILIAAELLPSTARNQGRELLEGAIEKDAELAFALRAALKRLDELDR